MARILPSDPPFEEWSVRGPYVYRGQRSRVTLRHPEKPTTTMAYARYLMCVKEGRWLGKDEHVDHIDNDPCNDSVDNLQILSPDANTAKYWDSVLPEGRQGPKASLVRWSSQALYEDVKASAALSGQSLNTYVENAVAEQIASDFTNSSNSSNNSSTTYRSLARSGLDHESIIQQLGGSQAEGDVQ